MTGFFTLRARGVSTTVLVAGDGVTPAGGAVPTTAMVTVSVEVVGGSVSTSWCLESESGGEADGPQKDSVSMQQYRYLTIQQGATSYLEDSTTCAFRLRTTRRSCGTKGRVSVNSTDGPGRLFLLASPLASLSARRLLLSVVSLPGRASAA
jgi:hypothetical protein